MATTIDVEAAKNVKLVTDIDKQRRKYKQVIDGITIQFISPSIANYEKYYFYLLANSTYINLDTKYNYRPDYLSYEQYGTTTLWSLLLYINRVHSIEDFTGPKVYVPTLTSIIEVSKKDQTLQNVIDLDNINSSSGTNLFKEIYSSKVSPPLENQSTVVTTEDNTLPSYLRQRITLNETMIANKFVDLAFVPILETVTLKIIGETSVLIYDSHYTIVEDSNDELKRLTWDPDLNPLGDGLTSVLMANMILTIEYAKEN